MHGPAVVPATAALLPNKLFNNKINNYLQRRHEALNDHTALDGSDASSFVLRVEGNAVQTASTVGDSTDAEQVAAAVAVAAGATAYSTENGGWKNASSHSSFHSSNSSYCCSSDSLDSPFGSLDSSFDSFGSSSSSWDCPSS